MEKNNIIMNDSLVGHLFEGEPHSENLPVIEEINGPLCFKFVGDKCSFVLGSLAVVDFVVEAKGIAKEHVSFVMDINGVRIIPILQHKTLLDNQLVTEPQILSHGAIISLADKRFVFKEQADASVGQKNQEQPKPAAKKSCLKKEAVSHKTVDLAKKNHLGLKTFDAIFMIFFISALLGAVFIYQKF